MVPTTAPPSFMPNTRGILNSWLGSPGGTPKLVSTPLDHSASETDPSELAIPPTTTPLLFRASPPVLENGMKGSGVKSYRSAAKQEFMVSRCSMAFQYARSVYSRPRVGILRRARSHTCRRSRVSEYNAPSFGKVHRTRTVRRCDLIFALSGGASAGVRKELRRAAGTSTSHARRSPVSAAAAVGRPTPAPLPAGPSSPRSSRHAAPIRQCRR
jgi:hypothetical protein